MRILRSVRLLPLLFFCSVPLLNAAHPAETPERIPRAAGPITIDANLDDAGWKGALRREQWFETNPGDNTEPAMKSVGYITYDDRFLYVAIESFDPDPRQIRAQLSDHDSISGNTDDFAGVILDTRNDGKTGLELFVTARGTQFDAVLDDTTGNEDSSPDFFWDSETKITDRGWILEMRVPFSSLRYKKEDPLTMGVMLYRNVPRDRRYQYFTHRLPRGANCFVCNFNKVTGFEGLPAGGHIVAAPYVTVKELGETRDGLGTALVNRPAKGDGGLDVKWTPNAVTAVDATINPDFSQVESDVAAISTNERFAIFFPEKRPFFLEGVELFSTPIQAVYTRTITSPRWGLRSTGKLGGDAYTLLIAQDRGGGSIILPSATGSDFADQDFSSNVAIGRVRHDFGSNSFVSVLGTAREEPDGAHNRVFGPDFQWKPNDRNTVTGQFLLSDSVTPDRTDLAKEWNGQKLRSHAGHLWWQYTDAQNDVYAEYKDFGDEFRADNGFVPQVAFRSNYAEVGHTWRPTGFFNRVRAFAIAQYDSEQSGPMLYRLHSAGFETVGKFRSSMRFRYAYDDVRSGDRVFLRHQLLYNISFAVSRVVSQVNLSGWVGQDVDFDNSRLGRGANLSVGGTLRPNPHLQITLTNSMRWLTVRPTEIPAVAALRGRLFTAQVERIRAQYTFTPRMFVRAIVQNQRTARHTNFYIDTTDVDPRSGQLATQALFAYKLNWQSVLFFGFGDLRGVTADEGDFEKDARQVFLKVSYAFQR